MCAKDGSPCETCKSKNNVTENKVYFTDKIAFDPNEKKLVSVTDGVLLYSGFEIGKEPFDKTFKVFRDAKTIIDLAPRLINLPITDQHVDPEPGTTPLEVIGKLTSSEWKYFDEPEKLATVLVENNAIFEDGISIKPGEHLSLGYTGDLVKANESDPFDFKQINLMPHHLAKLGDAKGRCGNTCKFTDRSINMKPKKFSEYKFRDEDGSINLNELMDLISALPEAVGSLTVEQINELVPMFKEIIESAKAAREDKKIETEETTEKTTEEKPAADDSVTKEEVTTELTDEDKEVSEFKAMDSAKFKDALAVRIKTGVAQGIKEYAYVVEKARNFLDAAYPFATKTAKQIMNDAVATRYKEKFNDQELSIAFKLLSKATGYEKFADSKTEDAFDKLKNKEL